MATAVQPLAVQAIFAWLFSTEQGSKPFTDVQLILTKLVSFQSPQCLRINQQGFGTMLNCAHYHVDGGITVAEKVVPQAE